MTGQQFEVILEALKPGVSFQWVDDNYSGFTCKDPLVTPPTWDEVLAKYAELFPEE